MTNWRTICAKRFECLNNDAELCSLYYVSAATETLKRIERRRIDSIDIRTALSHLTHQIGPINLRVYTFLLKGAIRVCYMKLKYCELDISNLACEKKKDAVMVKGNKRRFASGLKLDHALIENMLKGIIVKHEKGHVDHLDDNVNISENMDILRDKASLKNGDNLTFPFKEDEMAFCYDDENPLNEWTCERKRTKVRNEKADIILDIKGNDFIGYVRNISDTDTTRRRGEIAPVLAAFSSVLSGIRREGSSRHIQKEDVSCVDFEYTPTHSQSYNIIEDRSTLSSNNKSRQESTSHQIHLFENHNHVRSGGKDREGRAMNFYRIILEASNGRIFVKQDTPYGEILVRNL